MTARKGWFQKLLMPERAPRRPAGQFFSYRLQGHNVVQEPIRDISSSGAFLLTAEQFPVGALLAVTMQADGPFELNPARRITAIARVARVATDGVGLQFIPPADAHARRWADLVEYLARQVKPAEMYAFLRLNAAFVFLGRIAPRSSDEVETLVREKINSNFRIENVVDATLNAEERLAAEPDLDKLHTESLVVTRFLEGAALAEEGWLRELWTGLLVASCTDRVKDDEHPVLAELLSRLSAVQIRMLATVSDRAHKLRAPDGGFVARPATFTIDEFIGITGARDAHIDRDLQLLHQLDLLEMKPDSIITKGEAELAPTTLSLLLHAKCKGHRGAVDEFYAAHPND